TIARERARFDASCAAALQILDELKQSDEAALFIATGPAYPETGRLFRNQEQIRQIVARSRVSHERADLVKSLRQAQALLSHSAAPNKFVYVLTDMQKTSWENFNSDSSQENSLNHKKQSPTGDRLGRPKDSLQAEKNNTACPVIFVDCSRAPKPNAALLGMELQAAVPVTLMPLKAAVHLLNTSTIAQKRLVDLYIDGKHEATSPELSLPGGGSLRYDFPVNCKTPGLHCVEARLAGRDGSKYDDRRYCVIKLDQRVPVAVVKDQKHEVPYLDDGFYLEKALAPVQSGAWVIQPSTLLADDLQTAPLEKYKVIFCVNLPAPGELLTRRLCQYVVKGGNLVWIAGDNVVPDEYNRMNEQADAQLLPAPLLDVRGPNVRENRD
ncbi:MAG: hypothetical protein ACWGMZ_08185, partial [Thermoguttaceae bacterium]